MIYFKHCREVNMTYSQHFMRSMGFALIMSASSIKAMIHAVCPPLYKTSSTDTVKRLYKKLQN